MRASVVNPIYLYQINPIFFDKKKGEQPDPWTRPVWLFFSWESELKDSCWESGGGGA